VYTSNTKHSSSLFKMSSFFNTIKHIGKYNISRSHDQKILIFSNYITVSLDLQIIYFYFLYFYWPQERLGFPELMCCPTVIVLVYLYSVLFLSRKKPLINTMKNLEGQKSKDPVRCKRSL
jgi:hypothetical protein